MRDVFYTLLYVLGATLVFIFIATLVSHRRMRKHRGVSREEFISAFSGTNIPAEIPATVYDYYKRMVIFKEFGIAPDDAYQDVLCEGEEEIDDDAEFLMKELGLKPPSEEVRLQWTEQILASRREPPHPLRLSADSTQWMQPIQTLREMVLWLDWVREHQPKDGRVTQQMTCPPKTSPTEM